MSKTSAQKDYGNENKKRKEIRDEKATNGVSFIGSVPCRVERTDRP